MGLPSFTAREMFKSTLIVLSVACVILLLSSQAEGHTIKLNETEPVLEKRLEPEFDHEHMDHHQNGDSDYFKDHEHIDHHAHYIGDGHDHHEGDGHDHHDMRVNASLPSVASHRPSPISHLSPT